MSTFTVGDTAPALVGQCNANLTNASVELHMRKPTGVVLTKTAALSDATQGIWAYSWVAGDLDVSGRWEVEAQVTFQGGAVQTFGVDDAGRATAFDVRDQIA